MDSASTPEEALEKPKRRDYPWLRSLVIVVVLVAVDRAIQLPYLVFGPGDALPTSELIDVAADKRLKPRGDLLLTTVTLKEAHPTDIFWAWVKPSEVIEKRKDTLQGLTTEEYLEVNRNLVDTSKLVSVAVAMRKSGYTVSLIGEGAEISEVQEGAPAEGKLRKSDVLISVAGNPVSTAQAATDVIRNSPPGVPLTVEVVDTSGVRRTESVTPGRRDDGASFLGLRISTKNPRVDTPFEIGIKDTPFGGPSAGLAFTLSLIDNLTAGELTAGRRVAVTGTIEADGRVGPVGGVVQKTHAVNDSSAKLLLVPSAELEDAREIADDDVEVVGVDTLDQALEALRNSGGDPIPGS